MKKNDILKAGVIALAAPLFAQADATVKNIVVILADDLGVMDLGCYNKGTFYETPNLDRLAAQGVRFTNGYASCPVCSPSRFGLMTGRYATRAGATDWFGAKRGGRFQPAQMIHHMPLEEVTLAGRLRETGYQTFFVGKWHLGADEKYWPEHRGFDTNVAGWMRGSPGSYFSPYKNPRLPDGPAGEFLTDRLASESIALLRSRDKTRPFLLYHSFYQVHTPLRAPAELIEKYKAKAEKLGLDRGEDFGEEEQSWQRAQPRRVRIRQNHAVYAAMVESMDTAVGRILDELGKQGLLENTLVIFTSDNGGLSTSEGHPTCNLPYRGGKGWMYEGGLRVPYIARLPGATRDGRVCDTPVCGIDLLPTTLAFAGVALPVNREIDGVNLMPLLEKNEAPERDALYWHYPHYGNQGGFPSSAIRMGDWKLIERLEDGRVHLYNLRADIGEKRDLAAREPERVAKMRAKLHAWYKQTGARFLEPKPGGPVPWRPDDK
ncbi:arylsulfatase A-like enzyme [Ereboglobus sp. PH5-5]|uniref:sulfatase n=1 Tax=Ereboglobus sp. PH5-5 TaxID=2940529 RepID=UPI002406D914|nr:sulfatase [Ereboglobus sp. PH5-5]MDF9833565.1 arylsulfatase A-like enzyme [Ereboglobus sp. PH5-5]